MSRIDVFYIAKCGWAGSRWIYRFRRGLARDTSWEVSGALNLKHIWGQWGEGKKRAGEAGCISPELKHLEGRDLVSQLLLP